jgi:hypothetical protein
MGSVHKGVATLFFFEQRAVQDRGVAPLFRTSPGTKEATSKNSRREQPQPSREPPKRGFMLRACLCLCRLWQRDQHDHTCLFVFVMHARSCLCRLLQPPCRKEEDINKGAAVKGAANQGEFQTSAQDSTHGLMALPIRGKTATWVPLPLSFLI